VAGGSPEGCKGFREDSHRAADRRPLCPSGQAEAADQGTPVPPEALPDVVIYPGSNPCNFRRSSRATGCPATTFGGALPP
jgi:hypothetical protein